MHRESERCDKLEFLKHSLIYNPETNDWHMCSSQKEGKIEGV